MLGVDNKHFEVLAQRDGRLAPIPFQVDEVQTDGAYALANGPGSDRKRGRGTLDRNDEVVMMLADLGSRISDPAKLPKGTLEISALEPQSKARRYAYIAGVSSPQRSPLSYIHYEPATGKVDGASYRMSFRGDFPIGLSVRDAQGGWSPNLIEGTQVRVTARVLMFFKMHFGASGVHNRVLAWRAGPIRVMRRVSHSVKLAFGIRSPRVVSSEVFYPNYSEDSFVARVLWVPRAFFDDVQVRTWLDFVGIGDFTLKWSDRNQAALVIGAADSHRLEELRRNPPHVEWIALHGDGKTLTQTFAPSPDLAIVKPQLYYCDGQMPPPASTGCTGTTRQIGYLMTGWENLSAGTHRLESILLVLPDSIDSEQVERELSAPPIITVEPVPR